MTNRKPNGRLDVHMDNQPATILSIPMDKLTLEILFMKMDGYGSKEISEKTGLSVNAIDLRIFKLKKKLKNFL